MAVQRGVSGVLARIPLESISARLAPWGLTLHAALTLAGSIWSIRHETVNGGHQTAHDAYQAIGLDVLLAFGLSMATVVTIAEVIDTTMVIAHLVGKRMKAQGRAEGLAEGREKGRVEGREEGREEGLAEGEARGIAIGQARMLAALKEKLEPYLEALPELQESIELTEPTPIPDEKPGKD